ncbi:hypothetical protein HPB50_006318 [Hyalomma asiaticum]|uniref:Uncharacterized protein n=1 Tax=Hyalomma asiaticum TaxID=266040 RepID=A0ACB7TDC9_HYAAI|nr:hypothetical protein HPB50_006318 [Hyalomma asiaticum]
MVLGGDLELWGDQWNQPPLTPRRATLSDLVSQDVLRKGILLNIENLVQLWGDQWNQPPLTPRRATLSDLVSQDVLRKGLEAPLVLNVTQWPCDHTCILVSGCSRLEEELWYVTVVRIPGSGEVLNARYQCSLGSSGQPQLLNKGYVLLPMGQELVLLEMQEAERSVVKACAKSALDGCGVGGASSSELLSTCGGSRT